MGNKSLAADPPNGLHLLALAPRAFCRRQRLKSGEMDVLSATAPPFYQEGLPIDMNHEDHVNLLRKGIPGPGGIWADLGSGGGAFTLALADLIGATGRIYSVDKNRSALEDQERAMHTRFPNMTMHYLVADFTNRLVIPPLDGVVMANSLHYVRTKDPVLQLVRSCLKPGGRLIIVEYNADRGGNMWVPYPFSYSTWETLARQNGFTNTQLLMKRPSSFFGEMYSALSM